ncbi:MAG TPA: hypothetical protein VMG13_18545 [Trebonia sp.]|nr:hypothetical protein [Trebonia sp.]
MTSVSERLEISASHDGLAIDDQTIDGWELDAARRALTVIKDALGNEGMLKLLEQRRRASDEYFTRMIQQSGGELRGAMNDFRVTGLTLQEFLDWFRNYGADRALIVASHPEHYVLGGDLGTDGKLATHYVMEQIGGHIPLIHLEYLDPVALDLAEFSDQDRDPDAVVLAGRGRLDSGVVVARAFHQFKPAFGSGGFTAHLNSMFPAALPEAATAAHVEHHAVEFRHFFRMAMDHKTAQARTSS